MQFAYAHTRPGFDSEGQADAYRRISIVVGLVAGLIWFSGMLTITVAVGGTVWPGGILPVLGATLMGRLATGAARRFMAHVLDRTEIEVSLHHPKPYVARLGRRMQRLGFQPEDRMAGPTFQPPHATRRIVPPLRVHWQGRGARITGPRFLVRVAAKMAVP